MDFITDIPIITRIYAGLSILTTLLCSIGILTPYTLYFNWELIKLGQLWRIITNFIFFGTSFNIDFFFHMFFLIRYSRSLEESSFRGRTADFFYLILITSLFMLLFAPIMKLNFLGSSLTFMFVYIWARRNPYARMNFLGVFNFTAPYLPYVLVGFSMMLGSNGLVNIVGIIVGHLYYFLEDVYPQMIPSHTRILKTPTFIKTLFGEN